MDEIQQLIDPPLTDETTSSSKSNSPAPPADAVDELASYRHVPLRDAGTRQVRYGRVEPLPPRSYVFTEDDA